MVRVNGCKSVTKLDWTKYSQIPTVLKSDCRLCLIGEIEFFRRYDKWHRKERFVYMKNQRVKTPRGVKVLSIILFLFGLAAFWGSLFLWGEGFLLHFPAGVDLAFPITDILVNAPASMLAAIGLWRYKKYGYSAAQFVAGFYVYASVEIFVHVFQAGKPYPLEIIAPQVLAVLVAIFLVGYLWKIQDLFFN